MHVDVGLPQAEWIPMLADHIEQINIDLSLSAGWYVGALEVFFSELIVEATN